MRDIEEEAYEFVQQYNGGTAKLGEDGRAVRSPEDLEN
jgi:hypothetical protein